ncbi:MAG: hypothetical protein GX094_01695 [Clostridiales bacterium]|nr:hypothetical protein [Clostridiales bacterium]
MSKIVSRVLLILCTASFILMPVRITHADEGTIYEKNSDAGMLMKNETVYVTLDHNGRVLDQRVVNRLYANGAVDKVVDYGDYISIRSMELDVVPEIRNDQIIWDPDLLKRGDIYYEGITDKELPIEVSIKYFLDGVEIDAADIAGKSGNVGIEIKIKNRMRVEEPISYKSFDGSTVSQDYEYYTPFLVQVSYAVDLDVFSEVKAEDAVKVTTGKTMNLSFATFPYPDSELYFEMKGDNIELNPITFTVFPQLMPVQNVELGEELEKLFEGLERIRDGLEQLGNGIDSLAGVSRRIHAGQREFYQGLSDIAEGSGELGRNSDALVTGYVSIMEGLGELKDGAKELSHALGYIQPGMDILSNSAKELSNGLGTLKKGAGELEVAGNKLIQGYAALKNINEIIVSLAVELAAKDPDNPELQQLNALMAQQAQLIDSLAGAGEGITQGAKALSQGMDTIKGNLDREFIPGMEGLADGISEAVSGFDVLIEGMSRYKKGQAAYKQGLVDYIEGVQKIADGLEELKRHSGNMLSGLEELVKALDNLGKGIADISEKGFPELQDGIVKAIDDMRFAEALLDKMEELVRDYRSFMDNQKNRNSSVQFIMKTDGIVLRDVEEKTDAQDTGESKANWWKRLLKLFGM